MTQFTGTIKDYIQLVDSDIEVTIKMAMRFCPDCANLLAPREKPANRIEVCESIPIYLQSFITTLGKRKEITVLL